MISNFKVNVLNTIQILESENELKLRCLECMKRK